MSQKSIGLIETLGLAAGITAADAAVKSANVTLIGYEYSKGDGMCTVKVEGDVGAVKAAVAAGSKAAEAICGVKSVDVIARPANGIVAPLIKNKENVGGEYHLQTGIRPKGQSAGPVLVKRSKPEVAAEVKAEVEAPVVETPEETPVEEIKEETPVEETVVVEETTPEAPVEEAPVVEEVEETPEPVAEVTEVKEEVSEPTVEEESEAPAEEPKAEEVKEETADNTLVVKSTSRGKKGGRRSKGNSPKKDK